MAADVSPLYENIGNWLKHDLTESKAWIISSSEEGLKSVGLKPSKKYKVFNGDLECGFRCYETYAGTKRFGENKEEQDSSSQDI